MRRIKIVYHKQNKTVAMWMRIVSFFRPPSPSLEFVCCARSFHVSYAVSTCDDYEICQLIFLYDGSINFDDEEDKKEPPPTGE